MAVGRILGPHGVRGDLKVEPQTWDLNRHKALTRVTLWGPDVGEQQHTIDATSRLGEGWRIRFVGFQSPEAAHRFSGLWVCVPSSEAKRPTDGWIEADLIGWSVVDESETVLGKVVAFEDFKTRSLRIQTTDSRDCFLPLDGDCAAVISMDKQRIEVVQEIWQAFQ